MIEGGSSFENNKKKETIRPNPLSVLKLRTIALRKLGAAQIGMVTQRNRDNIFLFRDPVIINKQPTSVTEPAIIYKIDEAPTIDADGSTLRIEKVTYDQSKTAVNEKKGYPSIEGMKELMEGHQATVQTHRDQQDIAWLTGLPKLSDAEVKEVTIEIRGGEFTLLE